MNFFKILMKIISQILWKYFENEFLCVIIKSTILNIALICYLTQYVIKHKVKYNSYSYYTYEYCRTLDLEYSQINFIISQYALYWRLQHLKYILLIVRIFLNKIFKKIFIFTMNWLHSLRICFKVYYSSTDTMLFMSLAC